MDSWENLLFFVYKLISCEPQIVLYFLHNHSIRLKTSQPTGLAFPAYNISVRKTNHRDLQPLPCVSVCVFISPNFKFTIDPQSLERLGFVAPAINFLFYCQMPDLLRGKAAKTFAVGYFVRSLCSRLLKQF